MAAVSPRAETSAGLLPRGFARVVTLASEEALPISFLAMVASMWLLDMVGGVAADSWLTLLGGREILAHGLPDRDALAVVSQGRDWVDQQWLAQLFFYGLYRLGGFGLTVRVNDVLFLVPLALALVAARRRGASPSRLVMVALPALLFTGSFVRAQVFSQLLFVVLLLLLVSESRRPSRRIILVFPLLALWANLHGAVVIGAALTAILGATEARRWFLTRRGANGFLRPTALVLGPWLCVFATPYGLDLAHYYRATIGNPVLATYVTEWRSPSFLSIWGVPFYPLAFLAIFLVARRPARLNLFEVLSLAVTLVAGLLAVRSVIWFMYASAILLPRLLEEVWPMRRATAKLVRDRVLRFSAVSFAVGLALVFFVRPMGPVAAQWPDGATRAVSGVLQHDPGAKVLANEKYADWVLFRVPAARGRIAFDGRWEVLSHSQMKAAMSFIFQDGADWDRIGRGYRLLVLDSVRDSKLAETFRGRHWRVIYRDRRVVVLDRGSSG